MLPPLSYAERWASSDADAQETLAGLRAARVGWADGDGVMEWRRWVEGTAGVPTRRRAASVGPGGVTPRRPVASDRIAGAGAGSGWTGVAGGRQRRVHGGVRRGYGVSGACDRRNGDQSASRRPSRHGRRNARAREGNLLLRRWPHPPRMLRIRWYTYGQADRANMRAER